MSGKIRKQLGPARKRLSDRVKEATDIMEDGDVVRLKSVRPKLVANMEYHARLNRELSELDNVSAEEQVIIDNEIEKCTELDMDAGESHVALSELIDALSDVSTPVDTFKVKQREKIDYEIEQIKVETELKRKQIEILQSSDIRNDMQRVKLPTMTLQKFNGKVTDWPSFWDYFDATINKSRHISTIDKFKYLMCSLEGEAKEAVVGFKLTEAQYSEAINHLKGRYENNEFIIHQHYNALSALSRCSSNLYELRKTFNFIETQIRSLSSMGENVENKHLVALIKSKLPDDVNVKLEETKEGDWTVEVLRNTIEKLISARERSDEYGYGAPSRGKEKEERVPESYCEYSGGALLTKDFRIKCVFCGSSHWSDECQKYKSLEDRKIQVRGKCFICLSDKHLFRQCRSEKPCFHCKRRRNHNSALCPDKFGVLCAQEEDSMIEVGEEIAINTNNEVIMKTARTLIRNSKNGKEDVANVLLDTGAKRTYITMDKAKALGLTCGPPTMVKLNTFGSNNTREMCINTTRLSLKMKDGSVKLIQAKICKTITGAMMRPGFNVEKYKRLWKNLDMADDNLPNAAGRFDIDLLIGNDYYDDIIKAEKLEVDDGLYLINSSLGWMFSGRIRGYRDSDIEEQEVAFLVEQITDLQNFWELEVVGIQNTTEEEENDELLHQFQETLEKVNNRYQVGWPWKQSKYELPDNYKLAEARLKSLLTNFQKDEGSIIKYDEIIKKQLNDGIIEMANSSKEYLNKDDVVTHYVPHHMVKNNEKMRIVYEGNAKTHKSKFSLNDCLYRGKNMVANLVGVLLRFRLNRIALIADIEKAYLQLQLRPSDRDVTRFLWVKDINQPFSSDNVQEYRFCRVIWGIISAAFLLACTIMYHLLTYDNDVSRDIMRNLYVDNLASGRNSTQSAIYYYLDTKKIFNEAAMNMREWASNDSEVMNNIKDEDKCRNKVVKLLGMIWKIEEDEMSLVNVKPKVSNDSLTKRLMLQRIASVYDPLGLFAPVVVRFKMIIQELWKGKFDWDDVVMQDIAAKWTNIENDLILIDTINIKRCINPEDGENKEYELVTFCDASKKAYAAAVYLRVVGDESVHVNLIYSKARLAPIKEMTIPRLELLGVLIGCRASEFVAKQLGIPGIKQTLLTDSKCVLEWCISKKELKRFVKDKIEEIKKCSIKLGYVESGSNSADIASRGKSVRNLRNNELWWKGPEWLSIRDYNLLQERYEITEEVSNDVISEERGLEILHETSLMSADRPDDLVSPFKIDDGKFSSYTKMIRITAWCLRFIINAKREKVLEGVLSPDELKLSSDKWIKFIQLKKFPEVISAINNNKFNSLRYNLGVEIDDKGMLRCVGRFQSIETAPKLLPKTDHITDLIIKRNHVELLHAGVSQTLSGIRNEFWIIHGRSAVKKIVRKCLVCKFWEGGPFKTPKFAPIPDSAKCPNIVPFTYVGIDYFGPLQAKYDDNILKNWICLFTCVTVRAVHLELVENMTCESFLLCLRRFIARRGKPHTIICDNANQFKLGNMVVDKVWNEVSTDPDVQSYIANEGIYWKCIIEYSPWRGGFYERLVGLTKRSLKKSLGKRMVSGQYLRTLLVETEAIINSRPLTYLDDDINSRRAITPAHFINFNIRTGVPDVSADYYEARELSSKVLLQNWKKGQESLNYLWSIWNEEYLQALRERHTPQMKSLKGESAREPEIGEVVLIKQELLPRGSWKLGRIEEKIKSEVDGVTRAVKLTTTSGKVLRRPLRMLFPLECRDDKELDENENNAIVEEPDPIGKDDRRPTRGAAIRARTAMKTMQ